MKNSKKFLNSREHFPVFSCKIFVLITLLHNSATVSTQSTPNTNNASISQFQRRELLDPSVGLALEWSVNRESNTITIQVEGQPGIGNFALGLTMKGNIEGADVIYFEVNQENDRPTSTVSDMYGEDNSTINLDTSQNWQLISSSLDNSRILIQIQRDLDTCDEQDVKIDESLIKVAWDYGMNSSLPSQFDVKGVKPIYFKDTRLYSNSNVQDLKQGRISRKFRIPPRHTAYWCSIHKGPSLTSKHHIVGFSNYVNDKDKEKHVHHQLMYRCLPPPGIDARLIFEKYLSHEGEECYLQKNPQLPIALCKEMMTVWAVGGPTFIFPDTIGVPIGENPNEYIMLETHYDNPEVRSDLEIENGVDFEYTSELRKDDGSLMWTGYGIPGLFAIPPESPNFNIIGHCSPQCITEMFPTGVEIHAVAPHAHTQVRKMRFRHIRGTQELPWIQNDDNYDFNYQELRMLPEPVTVLPGDHWITECTFDSTGRNNSVTSSGFSTRAEMCTAFIVMNKRIPYLLCSSEYPADTLKTRFGIEDMEWDLQKYDRVVTSAKNSSHVGLTMGEVVGNWSSWTPEERAEWEGELKYSKHNGHCPNMRFYGSLGYPVIRFQQITGGMVPIPILDEAGQMIGTPLPSTPVIYPTTATTYTPPNICQNQQPDMSSGDRNSPSTESTTVSSIALSTTGRVLEVLPNANQNQPTFNVMRNTLNGKFGWKNTRH